MKKLIITLLFILPSVTFAGSNLYLSNTRPCNEEVYPNIYDECVSTIHYITVNTDGDFSDTVNGIGCDGVDMKAWGIQVLYEDWLYNGGAIQSSVTWEKGTSKNVVYRDSLGEGQVLKEIKIVCSIYADGGEINAESNNISLPLQGNYYVKGISPVSDMVSSGEVAYNQSTGSTIGKDIKYTGDNFLSIFLGSALSVFFRLFKWLVYIIITLVVIHFVYRIYPRK